MHRVWTTTEEQWLLLDNSTNQMNIWQLDMKWYSIIILAFFDLPPEISQCVKEVHPYCAYQLQSHLRTGQTLTVHPQVGGSKFQRNTTCMHWDW